MNTSWDLPSGYRFAAVHSGIRSEPGRLDLALVVSDRPAVAAGVFTQNRVVAAPVSVCKERLPASDVRGFVVCSGNANACTGQQGLDDARRMAAVTADLLGCRPEQVLVCSTGVIGRHLPMHAVEAGIRVAGTRLRADAESFEQVTRAILTTDTRTKVSRRSLVVDAAEVRILGFAKGAAMIGPNLATMLGFLLTDAVAPPDVLTTLIRQAADSTFNCISVEGHTSTNDTVLLLANGSGPALNGEAFTKFSSAVKEVCGELARAIAADAEGAAHLITVDVEGLRTDAEARRVAKAVAESALVKTAIFGADPNWGRIISAAGYCGIEFTEEQLSLWMGDMLLYKAGVPQPFDWTAASAYLKQNREIRLRLVFSVGGGRCTFYTSDLTYDYVRLNAEYTT